MATSALVCINLKTRGKGVVEGDGGGGGGGGGSDDTSAAAAAAASTQQLVQALVDNGIIQLNHKATIRVIDGNNKEGDHHKPPINLGTFALKQDTRSRGLLVEEGGDPKLVIQNRPILVQRNVFLGGGGGANKASSASSTPGLLHLVHHHHHNGNSNNNSNNNNREDKLQLVHLTPASSHNNNNHHHHQEKKVILDHSKQQESTNNTTTSDGEPIKLPENLESLPKADHFPVQRHRWNTNEEIAAILITFERHMDWQSKEVKIRPKSGSMLLYSRKKVRYRRDGYCWKKRKDGKTTREDHMKLKVQGTECIYGCYVHSAILPTFHRRCYWLLQNPDIVLVHYLNVPYPDDNKLVSPTLSLCADKKQWTKEELISQLKPMFYSEDEPEYNNELEISTAETVETIVSQLLERQRSARASAICKQLECGCPDSTCTDAKTCTQPIRRIQTIKPETPSDTNQVSSTTGSALMVNQRTMITQERQLHSIHQAQVLAQGQNGGGPLVLNLSQIQTGGLLILNSAQQHLAHASHHQPSTHRHRNKNKRELPPPNEVNGANFTNQPVEESKPIKFEPKPVEENKSYENKMTQDGFYQTLDLTQEDIQQTLSANMPSQRLNNTNNSKQNNVLSGLEEIDFIDVNAIQHDDVLVNLDAFDMLSEFPELEDHNHNGGVGSNNGPGEMMDTEKDSANNCMDYREGTANITDFSPEWAYTQGGVKVLVTGPWYSTTSPYTVLFDSVPVPTTLVQSGVLRCFCPAHDVGFVSLQVACEGFVISNSVMFEYKKEDNFKDSNSAILKFSLMQRLDSLSQKVEMKQQPDMAVTEDHLVNVVEDLSYRSWKTDISEPTLDWCETYKGMTLLHLSAYLGYSRLICALIQWKNDNPSSLLNFEVGAHNQDSQGYTPLMYACKQGHTAAAMLLSDWEPNSTRVLNKENQNCVEIANMNNNTSLAQQLQLRIDSLIGLRQSDNQNLNNQTLDSANSTDDNLFIHPTQIHRNNTGMELHVNIPNGVENKSSRHSSPTPSEIQLKTHIGERVVKRPSVDSGIQIQSSLESIPSLPRHKSSHIPKLSRFDRSMSLPVTSPGFESNMEPIKQSPSRRMDFTLCDLGHSSSPPVSPSLEDKPQSPVGEQDARVLTLAEQIIAAMPERIKNGSDSDSMTLDEVEAMSLESPLLEDHPSSSSSCCFENSDFNFEHNYRYYDVGTPCSSLSPSSCLPSPLTLPRSPSPPPTTADFTEFLHASNSTLFEKDFSNLTLSDREQRELYEAAKVIQKAYRSYKGRKKSEQDKERHAAVLIQNCYRRYKQYAYFKEMTRAAMVIQNGFRSYCENKRFKKSQELRSSYRNQDSVKRTYSQRRQNQAARKIQQFMRQSKNKLERERAEKERQDHYTASLQN